MDADCLPSRVQERACYDYHQNDPHDPRYRKFLRQLTDPLCARLAPFACGLDYGCGPGPALALMLREQGYSMGCYDPLYADEPAALEQCYDFITVTEVAEHFHHPGSEFERLYQLLKPGGWLAVMTQWFRDELDFAAWHYRRDPTHVCFYRAETFQWISAHLGLRWHSPAPNIALLQRSA